MTNTPHTGSLSGYDARHLLAWILSGALAIYTGALFAQSALFEKQTLTQFERLFIADRATPPQDVIEGWQPTRLKDIWLPQRRAIYREAWYRTTFTLDTIPEEKLGLFFGRINSQASIWVNNVEVGATGDIDGPPQVNWNYPQLFELPAEFLKEGENSLYIRLKVMLTNTNGIYEPVLDLYDNLESEHSRATFLKITTAQILSLLMAIGIVIMTVFYFSLRLPKSYIWFIAGSVFWLIYSFKLFVKDVPLPEKYWLFLFQFSLQAAATCYYGAVARMLNLNRRIIEWVLVGLLLLHVLVVVSKSALDYSGLTVLFLGITALITFVTGGMLSVHGWLRRKEVGLWMLSSGLIICAMVAYDMTFYFFRITAITPKYPFIPLVASLLGGLIFFRRIVSLNKENEDMRTNISSVKDAITQERERLLREIHDGVGGQLVNTIAVLQKGNVTNEDIMDYVKTSLDDLRLIISSLEPTSDQGDILGILATIRERLEIRLNQAGIKLAWDIDDIPDVAWFNSEHALQLMRILQEAITNVVKHSGADTITLSCKLDRQDQDDFVHITMTDNGVGFQSEKKSGSYGLVNMKNRAVLLNGVLDVTSAQDESTHNTHGTSVSLWIPVTLSK
ncbi:ATP-binding protein [Aurantivibrio plasticivorans]